MHFRNYIPIAVLIAALYWLVESFIHRFVERDELFEVIPVNIHEFYMRTFIVALIIGFGFFLHYNKTRQIRYEEECKKKFNDAIEDIKNSFTEFLEKAEDFEFQARKTRSMDKEVLKGFEECIKSAREHLNKLTSMGKPVSGENHHAEN